MGSAYSVVIVRENKIRIGTVDYTEVGKILLVFLLAFVVVDHGIY